MNILQLFRKDGRLFRSIFLTYIFTPVLILLAFSTVSFYTQNIQMNRMLETQRDCLRSMQKEIDLQMSQIQKTAFSLANDSIIINTARVEDTAANPATFLSTSPMNEISIQNDLLGNLGQVGVYCEKTSSVLTSRRYDLSVLDSYSKIYQDITTSDLLELFSHQQGFILQKTDSGSLALFFLTPILDSQNMEFIGRVFVNVSLHNIVQNLSDTGFLSNSLFYMVNPKSGVTILFSYPGDYHEPESLLSLSDEGHFDYQGKRYISLLTDTEATDWNYSILIPEKDLTRTLRIIQFVILISAILSLAATIFLSINLSNRLYSPTETLLSALKINNNSTYQSAISSVQQAVSLYQERLLKNQQESNQLKQQRKIDLIISFCQGKLGLDVLTHSPEYADLGIDQIDTYRLVLFCRNSSQNTFGSDNLSDYELLRFVSVNVLQEVFSTSLVFPVDYGHILVICPETDAGSVRENCAQVLDFHQKELQIEADILVSDIQETITAAPEAYQQLDELLSYRNFWSNSVENILFYENLNQDDYNYSVTEISPVYNKIINNITIHNYDLARDLFAEYLGNAFSMSVNNFNRERYTIYSLITAIVSMCSEIRPDIQDLAEIRSLLDRVENAANYIELQTICLELFDNIIGKLREEEKPMTDVPDWLLTGRSYIDNHYTDQTLNISTLSSLVDVTPSYFSKYFKQSFSVSALDYINLTRVGHAKKYLLNGETVQSAALKVGYNEARTLIRYFRRYEGITPGQYIEMNRQQNK